MKKQNVEDIITKHAVIEEVVNKEGKGSIYLIGIEHWYGGTTRKGVDKNAKQTETLPHVQAEVYLLLHDLAGCGLEVVVGEGLGAGELRLDHEAKGFSDEDVEYHRKRMTDKDFAIEFFKANQKEAGYTILELLEPELVLTLGVDDAKEMAELKAIDRKIFEAALKYIPTKKDYENPAKRAQMRAAEIPLIKRKRELNDKRSRIYIEEAVALDSDCAIVIGADHVKLMAEEYKGRRRLYLIRPISFTRELIE